MTCAEARALTPAHALDALERRETAALDRHLAGCLPCRAELAAHIETASHLALAVPEAMPSPGLRRRILTAAAESRPPERQARGQPWWRGWWTHFVRLSPAVTAAALLVALGTTFWALAAQDSLSRQMAQNRLLTDQLESREQALSTLLGPGTEVRELLADATAPGARAVLVVNRDSQTALLSASDLPRLSADRVYQLWLIRDGERASGGTFIVDADGRSRLDISAPQPLRAYQRVGVTIEPAGGSPAPTGPRVLAGTL